MNFYIPTHIFNEKNCVLNHAAELCSLGNRALIVTGTHSSRINGSLDHVREALDSQLVSYHIFDAVEQNPSVETVMKAAREGLSFGADFVIGIGGGSPLDASKAIALMAANPALSEEVLYQKCSLPHLPVACIPTTAGTGSEATPYAILTLHREQTKKSISHRIFPVYAFVDASYLQSSSREGLVNTAVDTLAHLVESRLNTNSNLYNHVFSEMGLKLWGGIREALKQDNPLDDSMVLEQLMHASTLGGMAITHTGTSLPHGLSYPVTYHLNVPHGKACGIFLGGFTACYPDKEAVSCVLSLLGFSSCNELNSFLSRLLQLEKLSLPEELIEAAVQEVLASPGKLANFPFKADYALLRKMAP